MNEATENVFVYGSLRSGEPNHGVLKALDAIFLSKGEVRGERMDTQYGFPTLLEGLSLVDGEVYAVDGAALNRLDTFEGNPHFYERRKTETIEGLPVWAYYGTGVNAYIRQA